MISASSPLMANSLRSANGNHIARVPAQSDTQYVVALEPYPYNAIFADIPKMGVSEIQEIAKKLEELQLYSEKRTLNIEVIDDTALINTSLIGNGKFNQNNRQESEKAKKPKRRGGKGRKKKKNVEEQRIHNRASVEKKEVFAVYSREEMEALRFENLDDQKKKWAEVYCGLGASVAAEYDGLVTSAGSNKKHGVSSFGFDHRPLFQKSDNLDAVAAMGRRNHLNIFGH